jgi:hypothetical protein
VILCRGCVLGGCRIGLLSALLGLLLLGLLYFLRCNFDDFGCSLLMVLLNLRVLNKLWLIMLLLGLLGRLGLVRIRGVILEQVLLLLILLRLLLLLLLILLLNLILLLLLSFLDLSLRLGLRVLPPASFGILCHVHFNLFILREVCQKVLRVRSSRFVEAAQILQALDKFRAVVGVFVREVVYLLG